jgi:predicted amidohydrolase YtcJ
MSQEGAELPEELRADLVLMNGKIITVDKENSIEEAVAVKDGRIEAIGNDTEIRQFIGKRTLVIDLAGRAVLPGFNDAHNHLVEFGLNLAELDCRTPPVASIEEIVQLVRDRAAKVAPGTWIKGWGYDHTRLKERRHPSRTDLDRAAPDNPVIVKRTDGHMCVANSLALEKAGITKDTPDPPGGHIVKDPQTREPTGLLQETAQDLVKEKIPPPTLDQIKEGIRLACRTYLAEGITSAQEAGVGPEEIRAFIEMQKSGDLPIKVYMMLKAEYLKDILKLGIYSGFGNDRLKIGPIKIFMDGSMGGRTAALYSPYESDPSAYGILRQTQEQLDEQVKASHDAGFQVAIHAIGDRAIDVTINAIERALKENPRENHRHRIEHCGLATPELRKRIKELGIVAVPQPPFIYALGDSFKANLGVQRMGSTYPFRSFIDEGVLTAAGSDRPVVVGAPLVGIWSAVNRQTASGDTLSPEQRISAFEAIRLYTINGAYASFEEDKKGSIEPGKAADLVVVSSSPLDVPPSRIRDLKVEITIVDGKVMYQAPP